MYTIKKYANGRFYDTEARNYVTRAQLLELRNSGKKFVVIDTKSDKNITAEVMSQMKAKEKKSSSKPARKSRAKSQPAGGMLSQLIKKGGDSLFDYGKKYASMWQNMVTMSKEEIDKLVSMLVKDKKISEFEADKVKKEIQRYRDNVEDWFSKTIDKQVKEILGRMNLANRDQIIKLTGEIDALNKKITKMEKTKKSASIPAKTQAQVVKTAKAPEVKKVNDPEIKVPEPKPVD